MSIHNFRLEGGCVGNGRAEKQMKNPRSSGARAGFHNQLWWRIIEVVWISEFHDPDIPEAYIIGPAMILEADISGEGLGAGG